MVIKRKSMVLGAVLAMPIMALATQSGISAIVENVTNSLKSVVSLVSMVAYVAGFIFFLASIMKFKQHKDNPTQVPVGTPVSMVVMGAALMFAGNFIEPLGESIFGDDPDAGNSNTSTLESGLSSSSP